MRSKRTEIEEYFCRHVVDFAKSQFGDRVTEVAGITDRPDLVIDADGRRIAVELTQIPSSYIMRYLFKKTLPPTYRDNEVVGQRHVFPFGRIFGSMEL